MRAQQVQIDTGYADDGLYAVTFWLDADPPRYITLARDEVEEAQSVYLEFADQKYGFSSPAISYVLEDTHLTLHIPPPHRLWHGGRRIRITLPAEDCAATASVLARIFAIG